jgi:glycine oxidase
VAATADVVVVGAGIIGCAVAYELARRGARVTIVDDRPPGMGATQASAGMLAPYLEAPEGGELLELTIRSLDLFDRFVESVTSASGETVEYRRTGTLEVAMRADSLQRLSEAAQCLARRGVPAELVDGDAVRREEPYLTGEVVGGLVIHAHGFVAAGALTRALAVAARRLGAQMAESRARRIVRAAPGLVVETDRSTVAGRWVVMAAGSWAGQIPIEGVEARLPVRPVRGQLLQLAWSGTPIRRIVWSERCYLVPWHEGTLLVGATVEQAGFDERTTTAGVRDLIDAACDLVPHAWTAAVVAARAGLRPGTADDRPIVGASSVVPNLMYATGHYRNGVLLSPLTAELVADAILENRVDPILRSMRPDRFGAL